MRSVLGFAVQALALVALFALGRALMRLERQPQSIEPTTILVGSRGHLLPSAPRPGSDEHLDDAITVGDLILTDPVLTRGLRVVSLGPGLEFRDFTTFDTANDETAAERLSELTASLPVGSVIIAAVSGEVYAGEPATDALDAFPRALGAELSPFRARAASWAIISYRLETGWRTLAEAYSEERAVHLAYTLSRDPGGYESHRSEVFLVKSDGLETLALLPEFLVAHERSDDVSWNRQARAGAVRLPSITMRPTVDSASRILWTNASLPPGAAFQTAFCRAPGADPDAARPRFTLWVNGRELGRFEPESITPDTWQTWSVDLQAVDQRNGVVLELRTEVAQSGTLATYNWGQPRLTWGAPE